MLRALLWLLFIVGFSSGLHGQPPRTSLAVGAGLTSHDGEDGRGYHLNLRRHLRELDPAFPPGPSSSYLRAFFPLELQADNFYQRGGTDGIPRRCERARTGLCTRGADPVDVLGFGVLTRWGATPERYAVQLYFLPASAGVYLRQARVAEYAMGVEPCAGPGAEPTCARIGRTERHLSGGIGNGIGIRLRTGEVRALLEVRTVLMRGVSGGAAGALPISFGVTF